MISKKSSEKIIFLKLFLWAKLLVRLMLKRKVLDSIESLNTNEKPKSSEFPRSGSFEIIYSKKWHFLSDYLIWQSGAATFLDP